MIMPSPETLTDQAAPQVGMHDDLNISPGQKVHEADQLEAALNAPAAPEVTYGEQAPPQGDTPDTSTQKDTQEIPTEIQANQEAVTEQGRSRWGSLVNKFKAIKTKVTGRALDRAANAEKGGLQGVVNRAMGARALVGAGLLVTTATVGWTSKNAGAIGDVMQQGADFMADLLPFSGNQGDEDTHLATDPIAHHGGDADFGNIQEGFEGGDHGGYTPFADDDSHIPHHETEVLATQGDKGESDGTASIDASTRPEHEPSTVAFSLEEPGDTIEGSLRRELIEHHGWTEAETHSEAFNHLLYGEGGVMEDLGIGVEGFGQEPGTNGLDTEQPVHASYSVSEEKVNAAYHELHPDTESPAETTTPDEQPDTTPESQDGPEGNSAEDLQAQLDLGNEELDTLDATVDNLSPEALENLFEGTGVEAPSDVSGLSELLEQAPRAEDDSTRLHPQFAQRLEDLLRSLSEEDEENGGFRITDKQKFIAALAAIGGVGGLSLIKLGPRALRDLRRQGPSPTPSRPPQHLGSPSGQQPSSPPTGSSGGNPPTQGPRRPQHGNQPSLPSSPQPNGPTTGPTPRRPRRRPPSPSPSSTGAAVRATSSPDGGPKPESPGQHLQWAEPDPEQDQELKDILQDHELDLLTTRNPDDLSKLEEIIDSVGKDLEQRGYSFNKDTLFPNSRNLDTDTLRVLAENDPSLAENASDIRPGRWVSIGSVETEEGAALQVLVQLDQNGHARYIKAPINL